MEIERKFLITKLPENLEQYSCHYLEQVYISTNPVIRVRKKQSIKPSESPESTHYILTVKSSGMMSRQEFEMELSEEEYENLLSKGESNTISKRRYEIPLENNLTLELDIFDGTFDGLVLGEIEFTSEEDAKKYNPSELMVKEVTFDSRFHNSTLSKMSQTEISDLIRWIHEQQ